MLECIIFLVRIGLDYCSAVWRLKVMNIKYEVFVGVRYLLFLSHIRI